MTMTTLFNGFDMFSTRDRAVAELAARIALHADIDAKLTDSLELSGEQLKRMKAALATFERELSQQSPTLSSLLAATTKSKCCS
jgi:hypothetical protein